MKLASHPKNFAATCHRLLKKPLIAKTLCLFAFAGLTQTSNAKDLSNRTGFGLSNVGPETIDALSLDWHLTRASSFEANFGVSASDTAGGWDLGVRASRNLFIEDHLISSVFVGAALKTLKSADSMTLGYVVESGVGTKFFLQGLPNLGLGARAAFQMIKTSGLKFQISPIFSIHYYF